MKKFPKLANPFSIVGYNGPEYFCDREKEIKNLKSAVVNGRNITLIARRRIGKSSLLEHLQYLLEASRPSWKIFYIDLIKTATLEDLYKMLATALYESKSKRWLSKISEIEIIGRLRMSITLNPNTLLPEVSFDLKESQVQRSFSALLEWIAQEKNVLVIFDEFQQILTYPERNSEGFLRSEMMRLPNVRFIFCGSDQHLLQDMFGNHARPFFNSTQMMGLEPIPWDEYSDFIRNHFRKARRTISTEAIDFILHVSDLETFAVQKICNAAFDSGSPILTLSVIKEVFKKVLLEQQPYYDRIRALLKSDSHQFKLLRALAKQSVVIEPSGKEFMLNNEFTNSSSIVKSLKSLEGYSLINKALVDGKIGYCVNDAFFRAWLNTLPV
jgi:uncharacterized protein